MKKFLSGVLVLIGMALAAAETTFEMSFDQQSLRPEKALGDRQMAKAVPVKKELNFIDGFNKQKAFVKSEANVKNNDVIMFSAAKNVNYPAATVSFWFKPIKKIADKNLRFLHIYSPGAGNKGLLAYYFFIDKSGVYNSSVYVMSDAGNERANVRIPAADLLSDKFNKIDVSWNNELLSVYLNGELIEDADMPANFAAESTKARDWSSINILPVFESDGDSKETIIALDNLKVYNSALSADEIKSNFDAETAK